MPEGDTVFRTARRLDRALSGTTLTEGRLHVPRHATADLAGARVLATVPRGKHLLTRVVLRDEPLTLHTHLRMEGVWLVGPAAAPPRVRTHEIRARLANDARVAVGRLLGQVDLVRTADEHAVVGHLGPDLLDPDLDVGEAVARVGVAPERAVAEVLRDQRVVAGLGNELVTETLFLRGVHPWTPVGEVDREQLIGLAIRLIRANATRDVRSSTGDLRPGRTSYVYARGGSPCRRCGATIRSRAQGKAPTERTSWWCPACQPERT